MSQNSSFQTEWEDAIQHTHGLRVARKVAETHDSVSIVLQIPDPLREVFRYRAGQFLTFKIRLDDQILTRSYSLSSSPDTEKEVKVTIKRVTDGRISNWINDHVEEGSLLYTVPPAGLFVLDDDSDDDLLFFAGGSGITPCISIVKSALARSRRRCRLIYANRDTRSIIFHSELSELESRYGERFQVVHHLDEESGFLTSKQIEEMVASELSRQIYLCGPGAFMDTVESCLRGLRVDASRIHIERFVSPSEPEDSALESQSEGPTEVSSVATVLLDGETHEVTVNAGESLLAAMFRAGLDTPFSCEKGYCSCCMAKLVSGKVEMKVNDCLSKDLVDEGWVLTCQSTCLSEQLRIEYDG